MEYYATSEFLFAVGGSSTLVLHWVPLLALY
jgi:hypothetical protein